MPADEKRVRHFRDPEVLARLIEEIKARHGRSYEALADDLVGQIKGYFARSFPRGRPTRFEDVKAGIVRERFLLGLSGGIDSAVVAFLAVAAVGRDSLLPITMPAHPDDESVAMAALVRRSLGYGEGDSGSAPHVIDIEPMVRAHMAVLSALPEPQLGVGTVYEQQSTEEKMRSGNFGSRVRIAVLCDLQRAIRGRILGTQNRTEYCQGYGTKFGTPTSYDFGVLDELYKVDVYELAATLGVPEIIQTTPPSTGYFAGQTHEGELGATLQEQDAFAYLLFEKQLDPATIAERYGASETFGRTMQHRYDVSEHKRVLNALQEHAKIGPTRLPS